MNIFREIKKKNQLEKSKKGTIVLVVIILMCIFPLVPALAAENEYAKNAGEWLLDGVFWLALVLGIAMAAISFTRKNSIKGVVVLVSAAIICFFCKSPSTLSTIGDKLAEVIGLK